MANDKWQSYIDKIIEEAREHGEFDLADTKGKKLKEETTEALAGEKAMANKILANSGHAPPFLMKKREIDEKLEQERTRLVRYALRRQRLLQAANGAPTPDQATALREQAARDWQWAIEQFEKVIPDLNKQIGMFNLMNKIPNMHKMKIRMEWEIERAEKQLNDSES
ncbi:MAG: DUF1992 domain-containing protein [Ardenticatenales bacterium]|nr:DUF1992 domain-containing protein [Ardenticatenales bacterium]